LNDNQETATVKKDTAVITVKAMSTARKIVLVALFLHFCSLFFTYQDDDVKDPHTIMWNTGRFVQVGTDVPVQTGMQLKPLAPAVLVILFVFFLSKLAVDPFWKKYGYWITLVLVIVFATGGAVIRTTGGNISLISVGLLLVAALINRKELIAAKTAANK